MVILKVTFNGDLSSATFDVAMSDDQAREVARHLMAAAEWVSPTRPEGL